MMKIFVSIPVTGCRLEDVREKCELVKQKFEGACQVLTPFDIDNWHDGESWEWYMTKTLRMIDLCNGVYFCRGWENSKGCRMEYQWAVEAGDLMMMFER